MHKLIVELMEEVNLQDKYATYQQRTRHKSSGLTLRFDSKYLCGVLARNTVYSYNSAASYS